jgi:pyruvate,water dikinase
MREPADAGGRKGGFFGRLRELLGAIGGVPARAQTPSRAARFRLLYERFREILSLNDSTLGLIADIEDTLGGRAPFAVDAVGQRVRRAAMDIFLMVKDLNQIADGQYADLYEALKRVNAELEVELARHRNRVQGPVTIRLEQLRADDAPLAGSKMATLGEIRARLSLQVPDGFVATTAAFEDFMARNELWDRAERLEAILETHGPGSLAEACKEVQAAIRVAPVPDDVTEAIVSEYDRLARGEPLLVAMRSSAVGEDSSRSHAGQYHTELDVTRERLLDAYREVVASVYAPTPVTYRYQNGLTAWEAKMAVGCLRMVHPRAAGILFSRAFAHPEADQVVVSVTSGLAADLAAGAQGAEELLVVAGDGTGAQGALLAAPELTRLARAARELEAFFGAPQDVEWALDETGAVHVLQSRPMVTLRTESASALAVTSTEVPVASGGLVACPGAASGPVFVMHDEQDLDAMPPGSVLVARHSAPVISRVMPRCAAIVTEVGSPTGHMAILTREYRVPAIVGLAGALRLLSAGRVVTVDATGCRVFDGALALPAPAEAQRPDMADSPAMQALRRIAGLVTPLGLTDPSSPQFSSDGCRSLHDITRFVHEKVFEVMFHFGDMAAADRQSSIKLDAYLPIRVLLYDLGGAVQADAAAAGRATPEDVVSVPGRAFLDGLLDRRIRWDQPRAVSARGFLSVLGEGIAGPPPEAQQVGRTSYAVMSDRYMNFSTKAGYHFSTVDTYCGESLNKNYIHFRFERGGASGDRRERRVRFLHTVLSALDFKSQMRGDVLVARLEKYDRANIRERLADLGRLTMVARQLDMLMDSDESPEYFAKAFLGGELGTF